MKELPPAFDASVVFADFSDTLKRPVVRGDVDFSGPGVAAETFDGPNDAAYVEVGQIRMQHDAYCVRVVVV